MNKWKDHPGFNSGRYPWTYSADCVRVWAGYGEGGTKISRADASRIVAGIAGAIGMGEEELAEMIADYSLKNEAALSDEAMRGLLRQEGAERRERGEHYLADIFYQYADEIERGERLKKHADKMAACLHSAPGETPLLRAVMIYGDLVEAVESYRTNK